MTCTSENFSEDELKRISARVLGLDSFDEETFNAAVKMITVCENGNLEFQMNDGSTRVWENLHINLTRHKATVTDCFRGKIRCASCGNTYHRVSSANRWVYWYCVGKKYGYKGVTCHSVNFADYQLRQISAHILGLAEFDEAVFEAEIERITVLADGSLTFHFYEGRTEIKA